MDELLGVLSGPDLAAFHGKNVHTRSDPKALRDQEQLESIISRVTTQTLAAFFAEQPSMKDLETRILSRITSIENSVVQVSSKLDRQVESIEAIETSVSGCFDAIEGIKLQVAALPPLTSALQSIDAQSTHIRGLKKDVISKVEDELRAVIESIDNQSAGVKQLEKVVTDALKKSTVQSTTHRNEIVSELQSLSFEIIEQIDIKSNLTESICQTIKGAINQGIADIDSQINDLSESFDLQPVTNSISRISDRVLERLSTLPTADDLSRELRPDLVDLYDSLCDVLRDAHGPQSQRTTPLHSQIHSPLVPKSACKNSSSSRQRSMPQSPSPGPGSQRYSPKNPSPLSTSPQSDSDEFGPNLTKALT
jgi:hypothetical protein